MTTHVHFNLSSAFWTYIVLLVFANALKFVLNKWPVAGLTELVNNGV